MNARQVSRHRMVIVVLAVMLLALLAAAAATRPPMATAGDADRKPTPVAPRTATPEPPGSRPVYIVDPRGGELVTEILVVDPDGPRVVRTMPARYNPDLAVSPNGERLYVADTYLTQVTRGETLQALSVYDAATGDLLIDDRPLPDRLLYKVYPRGAGYLFPSLNGWRLFARKYGEGDVHRLRVAVLDARTLESLVEYAACDEGELRPLPGDRLLCSDRAALQLLDALTGAPDGKSLSLPAGTVATALALNAEHFYAVTRGGAVTVFDLSASPPRAVGTPTRLDLPLPAGAARITHAVLAPDGARLYLGVASESTRDQGLAAAIYAFDIQRWSRLGVFRPTAPAFDLALSADGRQLYTVNPFARSFSVFDTNTYEETGVLRDLGETPAKIVVP